MPRHKPEQEASPHFWLQNLVIASVAVVISILASIYTRPETLRFDEKYYYPLAKSIMGGSYDDGYIIRPPLYPLFLAAVFKLFGTGFTPVLVIQSLIRGGLVAQTSYMGREYASPLIGLMAGCLLAVYPLLIWIHTRLLNEVVYLPLFLLSIYMLERSIRTEHTSDAFAAGLCSGAAALARVTSFFFAFVVAVWLVVRKSRSGRFSRQNMLSACLLLVGLFIAISPWSIRNAVVHKAFIPLGNESSFNLSFIVGGVPLDEATAQWVSWGSQAERQREGLRRWREYVIENPTFHLKRMFKRLPRIFDPKGQTSALGLAVVTRGMASRKIVVLDSILGVFVPIIFILVMGGGLVGLLILKDDPDRRGLMLITVLYFIILHATTVMKARYFLPIVCLLSIYSAKLIILALYGACTLRKPR